MFDFSFNLTKTYTFWSGIIGGTFLMLSYFGTDQSQVQRYLTAKSVDEARSSLLMSAYWKIPLQALILLIGVLVFVFYLFQAPPLLFNPAHERARARAQTRRRTRALESRYADGARQRGRRARARAARDAGAATRPPAARSPQFRASDAAVDAVRTEALALAERVTGEPSRDVNYIIPRFVLDHLPLGLAGLFIAGGDGGGDVEHRGRAQLARDGRRSSTSTGAGCGPTASDAHFLNVSKARDGVLGGLRLRRRDVRRHARLAHRGREPLRLVLLRLDPRRLPAGDDPARPRAAARSSALIAGMAAVAAVNFGAP